jgi:hypothetical protein
MLLWKKTTGLRRIVQTQRKQTNKEIVAGNGGGTIGAGNNIVVSTNLGSNSSHYDLDHASRSFPLCWAEDVSGDAAMKIKNIGLRSLYAATLSSLLAIS